MPCSYAIGYLKKLPGTFVTHQRFADLGWVLMGVEGKVYPGFLGEKKQGF